MLHYKDLDLKTHPEVYEPREDSFMLLDHVRVENGERFLDMGCGTGIVGIAAARLGARVQSVDINPHAVELTKENAHLNGVELEASLSDMFDSVEGRFHVIAFNPPYLPTSDEERVEGWLNLAWDGGEDGFDVAGRFLEGLFGRLEQGGRAYLLVHSKDVERVRRLARGLTVEVVAEQAFFYERISALTLTYVERADGNLR